MHVLLPVEVKTKKIVKLTDLLRWSKRNSRCNAITLLCFNIAGSSVMLLYDCWQQCYGSNRIAPSNVVDAITLLHLL